MEDYQKLKEDTLTNYTVGIMTKFTNCAILTSDVAIGNLIAGYKVGKEKQ